MYKNQEVQPSRRPYMSEEQKQKNRNIKEIEKQPTRRSTREVKDTNQENADDQKQTKSSSRREMIGMCCEIKNKI